VLLEKHKSVAIYKTSLQLAFMN